MVYRIACMLVLVVCAQTSAQDSFTAEVIRVSDGDTVTVKRENGDDVKVRFGGIDTPELAQRHGLTARAFLVNLVDGKNVRVELTGKRTFDRMVGEIFLDVNGSTTDVSLELVKNGHAWWFWQFADEMTEERANQLAAAERDAKIARKGLYAADDPIYPRVFRRGGRTPNEHPDSDEPEPGDTADGLLIVSLMPNPDGPDAGNETVTLKNSTSLHISLDGWSVQDDDGGKFTLSGDIDPGEEKTFTLDNSLKLGNAGDEVSLGDADGQLVQTVSYDEAESGVAVTP